MSGGGPGPGQPDDGVELGLEGVSQVALIGSGGSSTVYRARQDALDRVVAVKVVHDAWSMETRERFEHERELMGRLSGHTAIVPIFETGITKRGEPYLLMPYYQRGSLFGLMRDRGPLPWAEAAYLMEAVALTVADCHREGIVHRDVKPGNVLLTNHLHPRLADFGIALPVDMTTSPATVAYTPSYSPPEAFEPGVAAATTDVYGLGATLWALLAGRAPNTRSGERVDPAVVRQRALSGPVESPRSDLPASITDFLAQAMAPDRNHRFPDATAFAAELRRLGRQPTTSDGAPTGPSTPVPSPSAPSAEPVADRADLPGPADGWRAEARPGRARASRSERGHAGVGGPDGPDDRPAGRRGLLLFVGLVVVGLSLVLGGALALVLR